MRMGGPQSQSEHFGEEKNLLLLTDNVSFRTLKHPSHQLNKAYFYLMPIKRASPIFFLAVEKNLIISSGEKKCVDIS
jgi:hypothetical protein